MTPEDRYGPLANEMLDFKKFLQDFGNTRDGSKIRSSNCPIACYLKVRFPRYTVGVCTYGEGGSEERWTLPDWAYEFASYADRSVSSGGLVTYKWLHDEFDWARFAAP